MGTINPAPFHLIIVGGGLAGLSAAISLAHSSGAFGRWRCTLLEKTSEFSEVGAGLQLTPNATRLLQRWDMANELRHLASAPSTLTVHRYDGTKVLAYEDHWQEQMLARYGAPFWDVHRADLQRVMVARARDLGVDVRTGTEVKDFDFSGAAVTIATPGADADEVVRGDVVLAADGLWSRARNLFLAKQGEPALYPSPTGDLAYRIILKLDELNDPELVDFVINSRVSFWIGPHAHAVAYSVRAGKELNLVLLCPDDIPEGISRQSGDVYEMRKAFEGWDPILSRFLDCVKHVDKWRLMYVPTLEKWNDDQGRFTMAGDACHPMLPYLAQGANSSLEDGAMIGALLASVESTEEIPVALEKYQTARKGRVERIQAQAFKQRQYFHMPDGPSQVIRDKVMIAQQQPCSEYPNSWTCPVVQPWLYGYNSYADTPADMSRE